MKKIWIIALMILLFALVMWSVYDFTLNIFGVGLSHPDITLITNVANKTLKSGDKIKISYSLTGIKNSWNAGTVTYEFLQNDKMIGLLHPCRDLPASERGDFITWRVGEYYKNVGDHDPVKITGNNFKIRITESVERSTGTDSDTTEPFSIK